MRWEDVGTSIQGWSICIEDVPRYRHRHLDPIGSRVSVIQHRLSIKGILLDGRNGIADDDLGVDGCDGGCSDMKCSFNIC